LKASHKIAASLAGAALLVALGVALSFWSFRQIRQAAEERAHTSVVIRSAGDLLSALKDAETGQRGYLLTGDETFLEPYVAVRDSVRGHLEELRQLALSSAAHQHLDALAPLVDAKMAELSHVIALRRNQDMTAALAVVGGGAGKRLMDSIRVEMGAFIQIEEDARAQHDAEFQSDMRRLLTLIAAASLLLLLLALSFAYLTYRETQHRLQNQVYLETQHLLEIQAATNKQLQQANVTLQASEEKLAVTLNSIGDAVIATDAEGRVTRLNPLAEQLTGWTQAQATGRLVDEIFHIINQETRQPAIIPVKETLARGTIHGLANHTVLIALGGSECAIADSCAPIRDRDGQVVGVVLVFRDVTKEYAARQTLLDNAALIQTILNTVADGIITLQASDGIVETVNPATERMFGYPAAELIRQKFSLLIPELDRDQRNGSLDYYNASDEARAIGLGREVVGQRKDGSIFPVEMTVSEMWLGSQRYFTGILRDITTRKQVEAEQKKLDQRLRDQQFYTRSLIESNIDALMMADPLGIITDVNKQMEALTGCTRDELIGAPFKDYFTDPERAEAAIKLVLSEKKVTNYELTARARDGQKTVVSYNATTFYDRDRSLQGVFAAARDVTERQRFEQALQESNVELESAKSAAEKANLAKSDFLSSMSHELRSPLNAILGFAQLMESASPLPTASQSESIAQILQAGWHLLKLINEILDLTVIESGKVSLSPESVSLSEVISECRTMMDPQAQQRGISMTFPQFDDKAPFFVKADRIRLKQIIINLLSNAIKYNKEQGTVAVDCTGSAPERVRISIADTGAGLSPEKLAQLFQPFNRLGQEAGGVAGTGIGLVVTKRLAELMEGVLGVESTVGVGSVFWCELNSAAAPQLKIQNGEVEASVRPQLPDGALQRTLLYVEDNPANMKLVEQLIARCQDIRLMTAVNGTLGIELARATRPQVILMDINLPGISGIEALKILREDPATAHIPVVALSANAMPRDIAKGLELGFFRYLTKPIKVKEFMDTLNAALEFAERTVDQAQARRVHLLAAQSLAGSGIGLAREEEATQTGARVASCTRR
jgi:PAS domain S-box-containing protein